MTETKRQTVSKKALSILLAFALAFSLIGTAIGTAFADGDNEPTVRVESVAAEAGKNVIVPVWLDYNPGVKAAQLQVNTLPEGISFVAVHGDMTVYNILNSTNYTNGAFGTSISSTVERRSIVWSDAAGALLTDYRAIFYVELAVAADAVNGDYEVSIGMLETGVFSMATDSGGTEAENVWPVYESGTLTVTGGVDPATNNAPSLTGDATATASIEKGAAYTLDLTTVFEDADDDELTYSVAIDGSEAMETIAGYSYTPGSVGEYELVFTANDGIDESPTYTVTLTVSEMPWWSFNEETGELSLSGTIPSTTSKANWPWATFVEDIESVTFTGAAEAEGALNFMFADLSNLTAINGLGYLDTSDATSMASMFNGCSSLTSLDLSSFDTSSVTGMGLIGLFSGCSSLTSIDVSSFDISGVLGLTSMFYGCSSLVELDLSSFSGSPTMMTNMFAGCTNLAKLDISNIVNTAANLQMLVGCFADCPLVELKVGAQFRFVDQLALWAPTGVNAEGLAYTGNWVAASDGAVYATTALPSSVADTYTAELEVLPVGDPVDVTVSFQMDDTGFYLAKNEFTVEADLSERYGFADEFKGTKASALDALVAMHIAIFGDDDLASVLKVNTTGTVTKVMGETTSNFTYYVNDEMPNDGVYISWPGMPGTSTTGYAVNQAALLSGDDIEFVIMQDSWGMDYLTWFEQGGEKIASATVTAGKELELSLKGYMAMFYALSDPLTQIGYTEEIEGAQIVAVNLDSSSGLTVGTFSNIEGALTDEDGVVSFSFAEPGEYIISAINSEGWYPLISPWFTVTVTEPLSNKAALDALILEAQELAEEDYTAESWTGFAQALAEAVMVSADDEVLQPEVDAATASLQTAMDALVLIVPDNLAPTLKEGVEAIKEAEGEVNTTYPFTGLRGNTLFEDADGDALTYHWQVSSDGGTTWSNLTQFVPSPFDAQEFNVPLNNLGTYMYRVYANDGIEFSTDYLQATVTVIDPADKTYEMTFYVGADTIGGTGNNPIIKLYPTTGYDPNTSYDLYNEAEEIELFGGEIVNGYRVYTAEISGGAYSYRAYGWDSAAEAFDNFLGGMSITMPVATNVDGTGGGGTDVYLRVNNISTTTKKDADNYFTANDYYPVISCPFYSCNATPGDTYVSGNYTYYPTMLYAGGNACLYNMYVYANEVANSEGYIWSFGSATNATVTTGAAIQARNITMSGELIASITVPADAAVEVYWQRNNFRNVAWDAIEIVDNQDGTNTWKYSVPKSNSNFTYRVTGDNYMTEAGWMSLGTEAAATMTVIPQYSSDENKTHSFANLGTQTSTRDEADIATNVSDTSSKSLGVGETFRLRNFRIWEIVNSDSGNIMIEPNFNIQVLSGGEHITLQESSLGYAKNHMVDITGVSEGTAVLAITYDAINVTGNATHGGLFPATNPERTAIVVFNVGGPSSYTYLANTTGEKWNYYYDTFYFTGDTGYVTFDAGQTQAVEYAFATTSDSLATSLSGFTPAVLDGGEYAIPVTQGGTLVIKLTDASGVSYQCVKVVKPSITVNNVSMPGEPIMAGQDVSVSFDGLYRSIWKLSGIFNPLTLQVLYKDQDENTFTGSVGQYQRMDNAALTLTIPESYTEGGEYVFSGGYINLANMFAAANPWQFIYNMGDEGTGTNFNAIIVAGTHSVLPDIVVPVAELTTYDVVFEVTDENDEAVEDYSLAVTDPSGAVVEDFSALEPGVYDYSLSKAGYICEYGTFSLDSSTVVVDGKTTVALQMQTAPEGAWDGTSVSEPEQIDGVFQISNGAELAWFAQQVNAGSSFSSGILSIFGIGTMDDTPSFVLTNDIDLAGYPWTAIGTTANSFTGTFDGAGYAVNNFYINEYKTTITPFYQGFFGHITGATVKNLTVNGQVSYGSSGSVSNVYAGGTIGYAQSGSIIDNVHSNVDVSIKRTGGNYNYVGGLVGYLNASSVSNSSNAGVVNGYYYVGGITGYITGTSSITDSFNTGSISGQNYVSGITAYLSGAGAVVSGCYNAGSVTANSYAGGISAYNAAGTVLKDCYNVGNITATTTTYLGGLVGGGTATAASVASILDSYNAGTVSPATGAATIGYIINVNLATNNLHYLAGTANNAIGYIPSGGTQSAAEVSSDELKALAATLGDAWNYDTDGSINSGYPVLAWQGGSSLIDKSELEALIAEAEVLIEADYSASSWTPFAAALADAIAVVANDDATRSEVAGATTALRSAIDALVATGFTVSFTGDQTVAVGAEATFKVGITSDDRDGFNALELVLSYDATALEFVSISDSTNYSVKDDKATGILTITSFGDAKALGEAFTLTFKAIANTNSLVTVPSAKVDEGDNANAQDAPAATVAPATAAVTVQGYKVTLGEHLSGAGYALPNVDYTFSADDYTHYDYTLGVTIGGVTFTGLVDNGNGTYTIPGANITGEIVVSSSRTAKAYSVSFEGTGAGDATGAASANYNTNYSFILAEDPAYTYSVSMTIGGMEYTGYGVNDGTFTIPGTDITGNIVVSISKNLIPVQYVNITFDGTGAGDAVGATSTRLGADYTFTLNAATGYAYTVSAVRGADTVNVTDNGNGNWTIAGADVTDNITITITKELTVTVEVFEYVKLDGQSMFLVLAKGQMDAGSIYAYDGNSMLWSPVYGGYVYLTIEGAAFNAETAEALVTIVTAQATTIVYDGDVNETGLVDINDAQLIWNMYNAKYDSFDTVSMLRFLSADMVGDKVLNVQDAAAVVALL